jgi:hypothetical protein
MTHITWMSNYAIYHIIFNMIFQAHYNGENHKVYITVSFCHIEMDETTKFTSHACLFSHWNGWIHKVYITNVPFCHIEIDESTKFTSHVCLFVTSTQMKSQSLHHRCIFITWKRTKSQSLHNTHIFITWKWTKSQSLHHTSSFYIIKMDETTKFTSQIS